MVPLNIPAKLQLYLIIIHVILQAVYLTTQISIRGAIIYHIAAEVLRSVRYLGSKRLVFSAFLTVCPKDWKCPNSSFELHEYI
jgi:hypothetical protein